jgi:hemolysin activation/secretion protein
VLYSPVSAATETRPSLQLNVTRFVVEGANPFTEEETDEILSPFLGRNVFEGIEDAADALQQAMDEKSERFFYRVIVPAQKPVGGVVRLSIVRYTLGSVDVDGNEHFSTANILASVPALDSGKVLDVRSVSRSLALSDEHPDKHTEVNLRESQTANAIDAVVNVKDAGWHHPFLGLANTGTPETGLWRTTIGYQNSNLFNRDHVFTASYTTSPEEVEDVRQYGLLYSIPLYSLGDSVSAYAVYSNVDQGVVASAFDVSGAGKFAGMRYNRLFDMRQGYRHRLVAGLDFQLFINDTSFEGIQVGVDVGAAPLSLRYEGAWERDWGNAGFYMEGLSNLPIGTHNNQAAYEANRGGATTDWSMARFGADGRYRLPKDYSVSARFVGQYASQPLIPGEQLGIAGASLVRGFRERAVTGDDGAQASVELWFPPLAQSATFGTLWILGFIDVGGRHFYESPPGQSSVETIASAGLGTRWNWKGLNLAADVAVIIDGCTAGCAESDTYAYKPAGSVGGNLAAFYRF